jgi:hypothetical protein
MTATSFARGFERAAIVLTPVIALTTVALALRAGAATGSRGALVYGAPPAGGRSGVACQIVTMAEESSIREVISVPDIDVVATQGDDVARWHGGTDAEGIAEAWLMLPHAKWGDSITLTATTTDGEVLARGPFVWPPLPQSTPEGDPAVRPTRRDGDLAVDVFVLDQKLAPGFEGSLHVRVRDKDTAAPVANAEVIAAPEPGLTITMPTVRADADGRAALGVTADFLAVSLTITAKSDPPSSRAGTWYGALPVAPGGASVKLPPTINAGEPFTADVRLATVSPRVYVEVDDAMGRDFGAALRVEPSPRGAHTEVEIPALAAGSYWLVTSVDPRGATTLTGSTIARSLIVGNGPTPPVERATQISPPPRPFSRFLALDGLRKQASVANARRHRGLLVALISLAVAGCLELLLVLRASQRAKRQLHALSDALTDAGGDRVQEAVGATGLAVMLLVSLLGFALIASLLMVRAR